MEAHIDEKKEKTNEHILGEEVSKSILCGKNLSLRLFLTQMKQNQF